MALVNLFPFDELAGDTTPTDHVTGVESFAGLDCATASGGKFNNCFSFSSSTGLWEFATLDTPSQFEVTFWLYLPNGEQTGAGLAVTTAGTIQLTFDYDTLHAKITESDSATSSTDATNYPVDTWVFNKFTFSGGDPATITWSWNDDTTSSTVIINVASMTSVFVANLMVGGNTEVGGLLKFDDIAVWDDTSSAPSISPIPTSSVPDPSASAEPINVSGFIALTGDISNNNFIAITTTGTFALSGGLEAQTDCFVINGMLALSGGSRITTFSNEIAGTLALTGSYAVDNSYPFSSTGKLALSGNIESQRVNIDVSVGGFLAIAGGIRANTIGSSCSIPSFDNKRWC